MLLSNIQISIFTVDKNLSTSSQIQNIQNQVNAYCSSSNLQVLRLSFCVSETQDASLQLIEDEMLSTFDSIKQINVLAQPPADGTYIAAELWTLERSDKYTIEESDGYILAEAKEGKYLFMTGVKDNKVSNTRTESEYSFQKIDSIFEKTQFAFSDIVRQWNFIPNIIKQEETENGIIQYYQEFNDVRSAYYGKCSFDNGYPAATGIGTKCGAVTLDVIAFKPTTKAHIYPVKNTFQIDAHKYAEYVLVGDKVDECTITTPKFERSKIVTNSNTSVNFISGTAAIKGQDTISNRNFDFQTQVTIENILNLVSEENTVANDIPATATTPNVLMAKAYIIDINNYNDVINQYNKQLPETKCLFVIADICRDDLVVEIEALAVS